ncbi:MAG: hypothetical protein ACTHNY_12765 [Solirubrobacterales bacterium]
MKHVKMLGLLVMAAASLMAFAGSASAASVLTSPAGTNLAVGSTIEATLEKGNSATLKAGIEDTCTVSSVTGTVGTNNTEHAKGTIGEGTPKGLQFSSCTKDTTTIKSGELTIADNGTVTAFNNEVTVNDTALGISCVYGGGTTGTALGTLTGGSPAKLVVSTTKLKKISGSFFCASEGTWTANYLVTNPTSLFVT